MAGGKRGPEETIRVYGSNRSIVRMIGTRLPIDSTHRLYVQLPGSQLASPMVSGGGSFDDEGPLALLRDSGLPTLTKRFSRLESIDEEESDDPQEKLAREKAEATEKLTSLESELARLKSQIALYSLMEQNDAAPPPAPPPPPPLPDSTTGEQTVNPQQQDGGIDSTASSTATHHVNISDEIGSVKLRKLDMKRSPGGTPFRPHQTVSREPSMDDPAAVIAHALRKKFSHRIFQDSPDKENLDNSFADSPGPSMRLFD
ncbi:PREDICTED: mitochondrial fission regulator 1-like [Amphimedon queenslandica]|uniref:Mitochondrial fission regulator 2 n=1 Tax=Amphimedon queenslandica TaxID=400682 RepID=A0A1X7USV6_AMPQE|nr:PREDICTED: mitochondrial fission regulator 1-like [Amphimedon queenslandica]|eukprot:XP_003386870.1 PREDICTED: mitochondrial fission regulator 1-like [Amphimedon queenslandica]